MGTACPARPLREKFSSGWHCLPRLGAGGRGFEAAGPGLVAAQGPGKGRGGHLRGLGAHVPVPESESELAQPGVSVVRLTPDPGGFPVRSYLAFRRPR